MHWYAYAMRRYAVFDGRARQAEFAALFVALCMMLLVASRVDDALFGPDGDGEGIGLLTALVMLVHIVPSFAVMARRLHDIGWSGWWSLLGFVPVVGFVTLLLAFVRGQKGANRFGPDPLAEAPFEADANWLAWVRRPAGSHEPRAPSRANDPARPTAVPTVPSRPDQPDLVGELERLSRLKAAGALTEADFEALKARALAVRERS